jgi:hypothetical protein
LIDFFVNNIRTASGNHAILDIPKHQTFNRGTKLSNLQTRLSQQPWREENMARHASVELLE